jgi:hypothetical protein
MRERHDHGLEAETAGVAAVAAFACVGPSLQKQFPLLTPDEIEDMLADALRDWVMQGGRTEPRAFLARAAWRNARDLVRNQQSCARRDSEWEMARRSWLPQQPQTRERQRAAHHAVVKICQVLPDARMKVVFRLRAQGEKRTAVYTRALGLGYLAGAQQVRVVKREKDRLDKWLLRHGDVLRELRPFT